MHTNSHLQDEMKQLIEDCFSKHSYTTAQKCLSIYQNTFGFDKFYLSCELDILCETGPQVSIFCLDNSSSNIDGFLVKQKYKNLDIFRVSPDNLEDELLNHALSTESKYISFYEPYQKYDPYKLAHMVLFAEYQSDLDAFICDRNFIDENDNVIAHTDYVYQDNVKGKEYIGKQLIEASIINNINFYGRLSTLLISSQYLKRVSTNTPISTDIPASMTVLACFYRLLLSARTGFLNRTLVSSILRPYQDNTIIKADFENFIKTLCHNEILHPSILNDRIQNKPVFHPLHREITFFYTDKAEYYNLKPIAKEAKKRGYKIIFTQDVEQKAEIGIYCQHLCFIRHPENSKFSIILLHDIGQGETNWPNHWEAERWYKFDIGILPGKFWADFWTQCACQYYANPRYGVFELGYPKSDLVASGVFELQALELRKKLQLKYEKSVLYAPSWENDGKEDNFVTSLASLDVNLLIKQAPDYKKYPTIYENVCQMRSLHEGRYDNVYFIEAEENIMPVLALCDIVVSDESGAMSEAVMFGKPSIAVTDWLIPDVTPNRLPCVPLDYVIKCPKADLRKQVTLLLHSAEYRNEILKKGDQVFSNIGNCCKDILDAIEYYTSEQPPKNTSFLNKRLYSKYSECTIWN